MPVGNNHQLPKLFVLESQKSSSLLGRKTTINLGIMEVHNINWFSSANQQEEVKDILNHYKNVAIGFGELKNFHLKFNVNNHVRQVA